MASTEKAERLQEISDAVERLMAEARELLRGTGITEKRAQAYWLGAIDAALSGRGTTMESTIRELRDLDGDAPAR